MGFHHLAVATRDLDAIHRFYTEALGFTLVKTVVAPTPTEKPGGWARHVFYDTGNGELMAFWDLHDPLLPSDFEPSLSAAMGLPSWVNHIAFAADSLDDLASKREHLLDCGYDVAEIDHGWCTSIYTNDPNGTLVEFCVTTKAFTSADHDQAAAALVDPSPALEDPPMPEFFRGRRPAPAAS
jgi:catechol 2,3-dioxygenase-like lactoylglutathione lyase family enzyme